MWGYPRVAWAGLCQTYPSLQAGPGYNTKCVPSPPAPLRSVCEVAFIMVPASYLALIHVFYGIIRLVVQMFDGSVQRLVDKCLRTFRHTLGPVLILMQYINTKLS